MIVLLTDISRGPPMTPVIMGYPVVAEPWASRHNGDKRCTSVGTVLTSCKNSGLSPDLIC